LGQNRQAMGLATTMMEREFGDDVPPVAGKPGGPDEPWDEYQPIMGGVMMAVSNDVLLQTAGHGIGGFGEDQARELLRIASRRVQDAPRSSR
ncbi:MAG: hypothetical protein ACREMH_01150, partial [Gemmatimonadales bacterium]